MKKIGIVAVIASLLIVLCASCNKDTIKYGVYGKVTKRVGNWMPGANDPSAQEYPIKCEVAVFDSINIHDLQGYWMDRVAISDLNIHEIARTSTNNKGIYQLEIPAGKYSIALVDGDTLLRRSLSGSDGYGWMEPLELFDGELRERNIVLDYAVY